MFTSTQLYTSTHGLTLFSMAANEFFSGHEGLKTRPNCTEETGDEASEPFSSLVTTTTVITTTTDEAEV